MPRSRKRPILGPDDVRMPWEAYRMPNVPIEPAKPGSPGSYFTPNPFPMPDLLTASDIAGMCQLSLVGAKRFIRDHLPDAAVVLVNNQLRVHSWAMARRLKMTSQCPGCQRPWPGKGE